MLLLGSRWWRGEIVRVQTKRDRDGFDAGVWPYAYNITQQQNQLQHAAAESAAALHFAAAANDVRVATQ